jgi:hypothetical protein
VKPHSVAGARFQWAGDRCPFRGANYAHVIRGYQRGFV